MSVDFDNGLIVGLSLQGVLCKSEGGPDLTVAEICRTDSQLFIRYDEDKEWSVVFDVKTDPDRTVHYTAPNGCEMIIGQIPDVERIYSQGGVTT